MWPSLLLALAGAPAWPCVALVHSQGELAESDGQETIFSLHGAETVVEYLVRYEGNAQDFGWVIPIPGDFVALQDGDEDDFTPLRDQTQPIVWYEDVADEGGEGGAGCGCGTKSNGLERGDLDQAGGFGMDTGSANALDVDIVAEGYTGSYTYTVVASETVADLQTWLEAHDWDLGDTQQSIDDYLVEGGFQFVLIELLPTIADTPDGGRTLPPVSLTYAGTSMRFPATMARYVDVPAQHGTIYILGDQTASISGWTGTDLWNVEAVGEQTAEEAYQAALWNLGGNSAGMGRIYAGPLAADPLGAGNGWVTRYDFDAAAAAHTVDPTFALDDGQLSVECSVYVWGPMPAAAGWLLPFVGLAGIGWQIRRRRST